MAIRPLDDRVLVEPLEAEEKTAGGILLPDTAKEKPQRGKIIAVGPGKLRDSGDRTALSVKVGDEVLFGRYAGSEIKEGGKEYKVMRESDILAKIGKATFHRLVRPGHAAGPGTRSVRPAGVRLAGRAGRPVPAPADARAA